MNFTVPIPKYCSDLDLEYWLPVGFLTAGYIRHLYLFVINCNRNYVQDKSAIFSKILFRLRLDVQESRLLPFVKVTNYIVPKEVCRWCLITDFWLYHQSRNDISESPSERSQILAQDVPISGSAQLLKHLSGS